MPLNVKPFAFNVRISSQRFNDTNSRHLQEWGGSLYYGFSYFENCNPGTVNLKRLFCSLHIISIFMYFYDLSLPLRKKVGITTKVVRCKS